MGSYDVYWPLLLIKQVLKTISLLFITFVKLYLMDLNS